MVCQTVGSRVLSMPGGLPLLLYLSCVIIFMAPSDNYPKAKPTVKEKHYDLPNIGVYKDKKGKQKSIW